MRKRITASAPEVTAPSGEWLDLDTVAEVEITSEDKSHPVESALLPGGSGGWRAAGPGEQIIRLVFAPPQQVRRIWLEFVETEVERTQEYVLRWSPDGGATVRDVVRQQWNFSPQGATRQAEDLHVDLAGVTMLELTVTPDISGGDARASLENLRLA
jgi:hypothetical protein